MPSSRSRSPIREYFYYNPSPSPSPPPSRSHSHSRSRPHSQRPSRSQLRSCLRPTRSASRSIRSASHSSHPHRAQETFLQKSASVLVGLGLAAVITNKFWNHKEPWETRKKDKVVDRDDRRGRERLLRNTRERDEGRKRIVGDEYGRARSVDGRKLGERARLDGRREREDRLGEERYYRQDGSRAHPDEPVYIVERGPLR